MCAYMKMKITLQNSAKKITDYLHHKISAEELVDWAETAMMEGEFEDGYKASITVKQATAISG